jgi:hypothetical protein
MNYGKGAWQSAVISVQFLHFAANTEATLTSVMNTNVFITDRCELSSLGLVASLTDSQLAGTSPPPIWGGLKYYAFQRWGKERSLRCARDDGFAHHDGLFVFARHFAILSDQYRMPCFGKGSWQSRFISYRCDWRKRSLRCTRDDGRSLFEGVRFSGFVFYKGGRGQAPSLR